MKPEFLLFLFLISRQSVKTQICVSRHTCTKLPKRRTPLENTTVNDNKNK